MIEKAILYFGLFLILHLIFYAFTGLALWGINIGVGRGTLLFLIHISVFICCKLIIDNSNINK